MQNGHKCRVRQLRLKAPDDALVRRGVTLIEDALRTASIPGSSSGQLILVRSLYLGKISCSQSSASIALEIERRLNRVSPGAIHASDPVAGQAPAVYFWDTVEAYVLLATRLAKSQDTDAWFWPLAVPVWQAGMPREDAIRSILFGVMQTQSGVAAAVRMVDQLHDNYSLNFLLSALSEDDGLRLMRNFRWTHAVAPGNSNQTPHKYATEVLPASWRTEVSNWVSTWGVDDPRSTWLVGAVMASGRPGRLLSSHLADRASRFVEEIASGTALVHTSIPDRDEKDNWVGQHPPEALSPRESSEPPENPPGQENPEHVGAPPPALTDELETRREPTPHSSYRNTHSGDPGQGNLPMGDQGHLEQRTEELLILTDETVAESVAEVNRPLKSEPIPESGTAEELRESVIESRLPSRVKGRGPTEYGGLYFIIPVLSRLGMDSFLESHPQWIENELPIRLLRYICETHSVRPNDPTISTLGVPDNDAPALQTDFVAPAVWKELIRDSSVWTLRQVTGAPSRQVLFPGAEEFPLGLWSGSMPDEVGLLVGDSVPKPGPVVSLESSLDVVLRAWSIAVQRWCQRYAGLEIPDLLRRPGHVFSTRTHVDIAFHHRYTDIRIRRAGLDLDPGWVPWLGRVVSFHYLDGDQLDEK